MNVNLLRGKHAHIKKKSTTREGAEPYAGKIIYVLSKEWEGACGPFTLICCLNS